MRKRREKRYEKLEIFLTICPGYPCGDSLASYGSRGKIVFTSNRDGNEEIYLMNPDGTAQTRIMNNPVR